MLFCASLLLLGVVLVAETVASTAHRTRSGFLRVVDAMLHWRQRSQVREDRFQILVGHVSEVAPRHDRIQLPRAYLARAQSLHEQRLVVIRNP